MSDILKWLETLAKYGIIDIVFGIGVIGFIGRLISRAFPTNYDHLHVNVFIGGAVSIPGPGNVQNSLNITLSNSGQSNFYLARAYFRAKQRRWWLLWLRPVETNIKIHPASARIVDKDAFELKFTGNQPQYFTEFETLIRPGSSNGQTTWLALEQPLQQRLINKRQCGVLYIEYAVAGQQGIHRTRI